MDYQVFLVSRMYEEWLETGDNRRAVRVGLAETSRVINSAAVIMISVFLAFVLSGDRVIAMFGIALAAAVALDAFVLRTLLVPALMHMLGGANWWLPGWLDRRLPRISIEPPDCARGACEDPWRVRATRRRTRTPRRPRGGARCSRYPWVTTGPNCARWRSGRPRSSSTHMDRARELRRPVDPVRRLRHRPGLGARPAPAVRRQAGGGHRPAVRHLAGRHPRRRGPVPDLRRGVGQLRDRLLAGARRRRAGAWSPARCRALIDWAVVGARHAPRRVGRRPPPTPAESPSPSGSA